MNNKKKKVQKLPTYIMFIYNNKIRKLGCMQGR